MLADRIPVDRARRVGGGEAAPLADRDRRVAQLRRVPDPHRPRRSRSSCCRRRELGRRRVELPWAERAADRSPAVQRSRARQMEQATLIVDAARRLIAERGERFTTQELVKEAGVALQTFYRIFAGKDQLLLAVFENLIAESCVRVRGSGAGAARIPWPACASTSPKRCSSVGQRERRRGAAVRHRRALAPAPALPAGDGRGHAALHRPRVAPARAAASPRASWCRPIRSATRGSSPSW